MDEGDSKKALATVDATTVEEAVEVESLQLGGGTTLVRRQENYTVTVTGVTAETADLHRELTRMQCESQEKIAKLENDAKIKVAEHEHVGPVKALMRPVWLMVALLGAGGFVALALGCIPVATVCFGGLTVSAILGPLFERLKKPPEKT